MSCRHRGAAVLWITEQGAERIERDEGRTQGKGAYGEGEDNANSLFLGEAAFRRKVLCHLRSWCSRLSPLVRSPWGLTAFHAKALILPRDLTSWSSFGSKLLSGVSACSSAGVAWLRGAAAGAGQWGRAGSSTWVFVPTGAQSAAPWDTLVMRSSARGSHPCAVPDPLDGALSIVQGTGHPQPEPGQAAALLLGQHPSIIPRHRRHPPIASVGGGGGFGPAARRERGRCREHCGSSAVAVGSGWLSNRHCNRLRCQSKMSSN